MDDGEVSQGLQMRSFAWVYIIVINIVITIIAVVVVIVIIIIMAGVWMNCHEGCD